ncbi:MAG: YfhO family protein, partial [Candidatus Omnitrophica bacterium]|nr:YfhO family protein [Candidatus Omnitrophota bacterium]
QECRRALIFTVIIFLCILGALILIRFNVHDFFKQIAHMRPDVFASNKHLMASLLRNMQNSLKYFTIGSICALLILFVNCVRETQRLARYFIVIFVSLDLVTMSRANIGALWNFLSPAPFHALTDNESFVIKKFAERGKSFRILGDSENTELDSNVRLGLDKPTTWGAILPWDIVVLYGLERSNRIKLFGAFPDNPRIRELTGVAYKLDRDGALITYSSYLPRIKLYADYRVLPDIFKARDILMNPSFDIYRTVVTDAKPSLSASPAPIRNAVKIVAATDERITATVDAERSALLVLNENYSAGWTASVDGNKVKIYRSDIAFKAVEVPAGKHSVVFRYRTPGLLPGLGISVLSIFFFLVSATVYLAFKKQSRRNLRSKFPTP